MGIESFFILILPEGIIHIRNEYVYNDYIGESNITHNDLKEIFEEIKGISYLDILELSCHISNKFLLKPFFEKNKLVYLQIEACLWYLENNSDDIINILSFFIKKDYIPYHPGINSTSNINEFVENLKKIYQLKTTNFITKYSSIFINENILPGSFFYNKIRL